jgi:hypothetical protein
VNNSQFPDQFSRNGQTYRKISFDNVEQLRNILLSNPYKIYCLVDEKVPDADPTLFLVLYAEEFDNTVILFDISLDLKSTVTTELDIVVNGYNEVIDVGYIERYPLCFYIKGDEHENI